eukprot:2727447-Karenia_brevis.AAC.1
MVESAGLAASVGLNTIKLAGLAGQLVHTRVKLVGLVCKLGLDRIKLVGLASQLSQIVSKSDGAGVAGQAGLKSLCGWLI